MKRQIFLPSLHHHPYFIFPEGVGHYREDPQHILIRAQDELPQFNLHIVLSGKGYVVTEEGLHSLQAGDGFLYYPKESQHYYSDTEQPWEVLWVHFNGHYLENYLTERGFHQSKVWTLKLYHTICELVLKLLSESEESGILHPASLSSLTYAILSEFVTQSDPLSQKKGDIYSRIMDLLPHMRASCSKAFSLEEWAHELNISTYYFCRMFKKTTGHTPNEFISLCRLQKSKQMLIDEKHRSIKEISIECGYPNISYFGKTFRNNEGMTPLEYRKRSY